MSAWSERDLRVLRWLHDSPAEHGMLATNWNSEAEHPDLPGLSDRDVHVSVETLADAGLVSYSTQNLESSGGVLWLEFQVSGAGLQALGEWPAFEMLETPENLGRLLEAFADMAPSDEEEGNLRTAAATVRSKAPEAVRGLATAVVSGLVRAHIG